jgi:hypothetical protein
VKDLITKKINKEDIMNKITSIGILSLLLIIWGCSKDTVPVESVQSDESQIQAEILNIEASEDEDYFYADIDEESEDNFFKFFEGFLEKPIVPLRFGRVRLHPVVKDIHIVFTSDTTAEATFHKIIRGNFVSLVADTSVSDTVKLYRTVRPMGHEFHRIVHFVKRDGKWRMQEFSLVLGNSLASVNTASDLISTTLEITKTVIEANGEEIEITDPLEYFQTRENVFSYKPGTEVSLTVYVKNDTENPLYFPAGTDQTELVRLHHARHRIRRHHRIKHFEYRGVDDEGNNVYQGTWTIGQWSGVHHAVIDVIDNGTIFDDDINLYPYNSTTWSTPYKIKFP